MCKELTNVPNADLLCPLCQTGISGFKKFISLNNYFLLSKSNFLFLDFLYLPFVKVEYNSFALSSLNALNKCVFS